MKKSRFTEEQITVVLKQVELGVPLEEICRKYGISKQTFYRWKTKYAGLSTTEVRRLKHLEEENRQLVPCNEITSGLIESGQMTSG